jgi:hypothetical protein
VTAERLRRDGRRWTVWTVAVAGQFAGFGALLLWLEPLTLPFALVLFGWAWLVPHLQARRGARSISPLSGSLGVLGDLLSHEQLALASATGLVLHRGRLGAWLVGEQGAIMIRPGGHRADCWCVRVAKGDDLPGGDRVAHLLLALREDEPGFATVANLGFSGSVGRVKRRLPRRSRPAIDAARSASRSGQGARAPALGLAALLLVLAAAPAHAVSPGTAITNLNQQRSQNKLPGGMVIPVKGLKKGKYKAKVTVLAGGRTLKRRWKFRAV